MARSAPPASAPASHRFVMPQRETPLMLWTRRSMTGVALLTILLFSWSIYRRVFQILRIELRASSTVLAPGVTISTDVVTSGEVPNPIRLELVQGSHAETLLERHGAVPEVRSFDPRIYRYTPSAVVTPELLGRFNSGPATLRLTGVGMQKLLRTPPPRVRELQVTIPQR